MKVRRTFYSLLISILFVLTVFVVALIVDSGNLIKNTVMAYLSGFKGSNSELKLTYDSINPSAKPGMRITGLEISDDNETYVYVSEIKISAGIVDLGRMLFGIDPETVKVNINGVSFKGTDNLLESFKPGKSSGFELSKMSLPFAVEITLGSMTADIDIKGVESSIGNINAFARIGRRGVEIANVAVPYIVAGTEFGAVEISDLRVSADSFSKVRFSAKGINYEDNASATGISALLDLSSKDTKLIFNADEAKGYGAQISGIVINTNFEDKVVRADMHTSDILYLSDNVFVRKTKINGLELSASLSDRKSLLLSTKASVDADFISSDLEAYADIPDIYNLKSSSLVSVSLSSIKTPVIDIKDQFNITIHDSTKVAVSGSITNGFKVSGIASLDNKSASVSVDINKVKALDFLKGIESKIPFARSIITDQTQLNGNFEATLKFNDKYPEGKLSSNISLSQLAVEAFENYANLNIRAIAKEGILYVEDFFVSGFDHLSKFSGSFDLEKFSPKGELVIKNSTTGEGVAKAVFSRFKDSFDVKINSEKIKGFEIDTTVSWQRSDKVDVDSLIKTRYESYPVTISFDSSENLVISIRDSNNSFDITIGDEGEIFFESSFNGLEMKLDKETELLISGLGNGKININDKSVNFNFDDMFVSFSDSMTLSFDMALTNKVLKFGNILINIKNAGRPITGYLEMTYDDVTNLSSIDLSGLRKLDFSSVSGLGPGTFEIRSEMGTEYGDKLELYYGNRSLYFDASSNLFDIPVSVKAVGSDIDGYYADISYDEVSFEACYSNRKASLYKAQGKLGGFLLKNMAVELDVDNKTLDGVLEFEHTLVHKRSEAHSSAKLELNVALESLGDLLRGTLISGAEYSVDLKVLDAVIGESINIPNTEIVLTHNQGSFTIEGNMINGYYRSDDGYVELVVDQNLSFGFKARGYVSDEIDVMLNGIFFPVNMINPLFEIPFTTLLKGDITGDVLVKGPKNDIQFYGMLYCDSFDLKCFFLPDEIVTVKSLVASINEHKVSVPKTSVMGYSTKDSTQFFGNVSLETEFQRSSFESFDMRVDVGKDPFTLWIPYKVSPSMDVNLKGNCSDGWISLSLDSSRKLSLTGDALIDDFYCTFELPEMPSWFSAGMNPPSLDVIIRTGKNVEISYPSLNDPFLSLTAKEGESVKFKMDSFKNFSSDGDFAVKTGRVYYFNNDFYVTDGHVYFEKSPASDKGFEIYVDVAGKTRQYDSNGEPLDIYLNINKSTLDNLAVRFSSSSALTENEIIQILGQAVLPTQDGLSLSSLASFAYAATEAVQKLNLVESNQTFSLSATLRDALNLDFLSAKTPLLANILLDAIPGNKSDVSLIAKYLNGTSFFAGKYFTDGIFGRVTVLLAADNNVRSSTGYFISEDLSLDVELSMEWETPFSTWTVSMEPNELSVFSFLDTIGITVSKVFRY